MVIGQSLAKFQKEAATFGYPRVRLLTAGQ